MNAKPSIFGPLSAGLPLLALAAEAASARIGYPAVESASATTFLLCILGLFILGIASGIAGVMRGERMRWLPAIGLGFNLIIVAIHFSA